MAAQQKNSIYTQDSKNNCSVGIKKPGTTTFQWQPLKSNASKITQTGSVAAQANIKYSSNSKTMQHDKVAAITLTNSDNVRKLPQIGAGVGTAADHIGKLTEKMQTTTISTKSKKTTDDSDKIWLPQMDGIDIVLPSSSLETSQSSSSAATSTTDHKVKMADKMLKTEEHINFVLYGPRKSKRLPVFEEICPSSLNKRSKGELSSFLFLEFLLLLCENLNFNLYFFFTAWIKQCGTMRLILTVS